MIYVYNLDGIDDRRLIHKRTIDFVNERYALIASELDEIETDKTNFKVDNNFIDVKVNSSVNLNSQLEFDRKILENETEVAVTELILEAIKTNKYDLIPTNLGLNSSMINLSISEYNRIILNRNQLLSSAGINHPKLKNIDYNINAKNENIISSISNYLEQINNISESLKFENNKISTNIKGITKNEKIIREFERTQLVKESLYLFLLQKKEEAQVSYAITEPSLKVVEYASSLDASKISPNKLIILLLALMLGFAIPFLYIFIFFFLDTKIQNREYIESMMINNSFFGE